MEVRRIVTEVKEEGRSALLSDGPPPRSVTLEQAGGMKMVDLWHLGAAPQSAADGGDLHRYANLVPPPGGAHWRMIEFPPAPAAPAQVEVNALISEFNQKIPDFLAHADMSRPGMHATPTIDFVVILSGEIWLQLDEGEVQVKAGDCVVQRGTMHAWQNRSNEPCVMSAVLMEAGSKSGS